ncbi:MAG: SPOR domain-containing protein [Reichenbachiella sp.]
MADDSLNEGSEEEKKSSDGGMSDDDFGLPDLEFDDLEELDMNSDDSEDDSDSSTNDVSEDTSGSTEFDMSLLEESSDFAPDAESGLQEGDLDPPENTALDQGIDEVEDVLDSAQLISDRLGDDEGDSAEPSMPENYDDLIQDSTPEPEPEAEDTSIPDSSSLFADIDSPDDLAALGMAEESGSNEPEPIESGGSLFSADDSDDSDSIFGSDNLSLDGEDKNDFDSEEETSLPPNYKAYSYEESSGGFTKIIVIGLLVIVAIAGGLLFFNSGDEGKKKVTKKVVPVEKVKPKPKVVKKEEPVAAAQVAAQPKERPKPQSAEASSAAPGEIVNVSERTSKSYIIIGSFVDGDLAMDYANELSADGKGVKIIEPYGKSKRYRVSIADYPTYGDAAGQIDSFKEEFGDQVWALKY